MQKNNNFGSKLDEEGNKDQLLEQPIEPEGVGTSIEDEKPKFPQVDTTISTADETYLLQDKPEISETVATEQKDEESAYELEPTLDNVSEGKVRRLFRMGIRWIAGLLIVFGLGLLTGIFVFYRPTIREAEKYSIQIMTELSAMNAITEGLEKQVADLKTEIFSLKPLKNKNEELLTEKQDLNLHIAILDARVDIANAQLALKEEDNTQARIILDQTTKTFNTIRDLLGMEEQGAVSDLEKRLDLVLEELNIDPYAAESDLDVLETKLLQLQDSLFGD